MRAFPEPGGGHDRHRGPRPHGAGERPWTVRRLIASDAAAFHALRLEGFVRHPLEFRIAPEDEQGQSPAAVAARLGAEYVVGGFDPQGLAGIGGITRMSGAKLRHRALLWGMYVHERARGSGLADGIVAALLEQARAEGLERVLLTVAAANSRARRLYERWGFSEYGVEPRAIKSAAGYIDEVLMVCPLS
jgi:GNAT superfamily N-acetyltransferase